jgi:hypothetical protein
LIRFNFPEEISSLPVGYSKLFGSKNAALIL